LTWGCPSRSTCLSDRGSGDAPNRGVSHCHKKPFKARKAKARTPTKHQPRGAMSPCPTRVAGRALSFREPNHVNPVLRRALAVEPQHVIPGQAKAADGWRPLPNSDAVGEKRGCQTRGSRSETVEEGVERKHRLQGGFAQPFSRLRASSSVARSSKMKAPMVVPGGGFRSVGRGTWGVGVAARRLSAMREVLQCSRAENRLCGTPAVSSEHPPEFRIPKSRGCSLPANPETTAVKASPFLILRGGLLSSGVNDHAGTVFCLSLFGLLHREATPSAR
jgi:hypothetical protein